LTKIFLWNIATLAKSQNLTQKNTARAPAPSSAMNSQLPAVLVGSFCGSLTRHVYDSIHGPRPRLPFSTFSRARQMPSLLILFSSSFFSPLPLARLLALVAFVACLLSFLLYCLTDCCQG